MFLTIEELKALTHCKRKAPMIKYLTDNHYLFEEGSDGWPVVLWAHVNARLGGSEESPVREPQIRRK